MNENFNFIFEKYLQILILHTFYQIYFGEFQIIILIFHTIFYHTCSYTRVTRLETNAFAHHRWQF